MRSAPSVATRVRSAISPGVRTHQPDHPDRRDDAARGLPAPALLAPEDLTRIGRQPGELDAEGLDHPAERLVGGDDRRMPRVVQASGQPGIGRDVARATPPW